MGYINITSSQYSKGLKEKVASALCGFYKSRREIHSDGYIDTNSTELCDFLKSKFKYYGWKKNHSQSPFDVYSIRGRLAIELKTSNSANVNIMNATLYSDKAKIKDVLSKKDLVNVDKSIHDERP
jgi:hypothetical protein